MKLTPEQTEIIRKFIASKGFTYPEVQIEILDHVATYIEERMTGDPTIGFDSSLEQCYRNFGVMGFSSISEAVTSGLEKKYRQAFWNNFALAFSWKYVGLVALIAVGLFHVFEYTELSATIFFSLAITHFLHVYMGLSSRKDPKAKEARKYLSFNISYSYIHFTALFYISASMSSAFIPQSATIYGLNVQLAMVTGIITLMVPYYYALWSVIKRSNADIENLMKCRSVTTT